MSLVVTLLSGPDSEKLLSDAVADVAWALGDAGAGPVAKTWLQPGRACDVFFEGLDLQSARDRVARTLVDLPVDSLVQPAAGRRKAVLLADMESTIIGQEMVDEMADTIGKREEVAAITARAMAGELDFRKGLEARVSLFAGQPESMLREVAGRMTLNPGARELVQGLKAQGVHTALVTGGFSCFAQPIAEACGFDEMVANHIEVVDGKLTGRFIEPLLDREAKQTNLERLCAERGLGPEAACAVGDGSNDAAMLKAAGLGVAYRGKPPARAAADVNFDHADLDGICALMGLES